MPLNIIAADLDRQRELLIDTLRRFLNPRADGKRFDWLYRNLPFGQAKSWLAINEDTGITVGAAAAFPRRFYAASREYSAWVLGDFCLDPQYRSLGPALQLQRTCLSVTDSGDTSFCYDFPSTSMVAVYKRLGVQTTGKMIRLAKMLRIDRKIRDICPLPVAQQAVTVLGNTLLKLMTRTDVPDPSLEISVHQGKCGEEFSVLACQLKERGEICLERSAQYLNWRYLENPMGTAELVTVRRHGTLKGFAAWMEAGDDAYLMDLLGDDDPGVVKGLVAGIIARATEQKLMTLSVWLSDQHFLTNCCREMGFQDRDSLPLVFIPSRKHNGSANLGNGKWSLMQGDRDS